MVIARVRWFALVAVGACSARNPTAADAERSDVPEPAWVQQQLESDLTEQTSTPRDEPSGANDDRLPAPADAPPASGSSGVEPPDPELVDEGYCLIRALTFNTEWASRGHYGAQSPADWEWKASNIVDELVRFDADIIALQEVGSSSEADDLTTRLNAHPSNPAKRRYSYSHRQSSFGQQVAILYDSSRFSGEDADSELGKVMTLVATLEGVPLCKFVVSGFQLPQQEFNSGVGTAKALSTRMDALADKHSAALLLLGDSGFKGEWAHLVTFDGSESPNDPPGGYPWKRELEDKYDCDSTTVEGTKRLENGRVDLITVCRARDDSKRTGVSILMDEQDNKGMRGDEARIWRGEPDGRTRWADVPIDRSPHRDVSNHLPVLATVRLEYKD